MRQPPPPPVSQSTRFPSPNALHTGAPGASAPGFTPAASRPRTPLTAARPSRVRMCAKDPWLLGSVYVKRRRRRRKKKEKKWRWGLTSHRIELQCFLTNKRVKNLLNIYYGPEILRASCGAPRTGLADRILLAGQSRRLQARAQSRGAKSWRNGHLSPASAGFPRYPAAVPCTRDGATGETPPGALSRLEAGVQAPGGPCRQCQR